jgi:hypothetical protein
MSIDEQDYPRNHLFSQLQNLFGPVPCCGTSDPVENY